MSKKNTLYLVIHVFRNGSSVPSKVPTFSAYIRNQICLYMENNNGHMENNNLNVSKKITSFWGAKVLFKKIKFEQKVRV